MGVPPQCIGETPSSERVSGAERSTGQALEGFSERCREIRLALTMALKTAGYEFDKRMRKREPARPPRRFAANLTPPLQVLTCSSVYTQCCARKPPFP